MELAAPESKNYTTEILKKYEQEKRKNTKFGQTKSEEGEKKKKKRC